MWSGESVLPMDVQDTLPFDVMEAPKPLPTPARAYPKSFENADERRKNFLRVNTSHLKIAASTGNGGKGDGEETPSTVVPASTGEQTSPSPTPEVPEVLQPPTGPSVPPKKVDPEAEAKAISDVEDVEAKVLKICENGSPI